MKRIYRFTQEQKLRSVLKPFGLESLGLELETGRLRAERFTPMPGVHNLFQRSAKNHAR